MGGDVFVEEVVVEDEDDTVFDISKSDVNKDVEEVVVGGGDDTVFDISKSDVVKDGGWDGFDEEGEDDVRLGKVNVVFKKLRGW
ncbi:Uu.00g074870.m01.CDS01 [Anthostomella pinea]|uniref:Uu.00g074870.m01.CDS01 n=1 Tax=Anthostomella pinea TaxID=933095 RepID=A0AAI8VVJ4_9PEZI|nr:Uu.00g074870.m01.CDS01 [Anthostomella pinea]